MKPPPRQMPVLQRSWKLPEGAFAVALLEGHVLRGSNVPPDGPLHVVAFREGEFRAMTQVKWPEGFVMQLPAGKYRLAAFEQGREIASAEVRASLGVHKVSLVPDGAPEEDVEVEWEVATPRDGGYKN